MTDIPKEVKVVIVGSGVAAAMVAMQLKKRNIGPILILEAGPEIPMMDNRTWIDFIMTQSSPSARCQDIATEYSSTPEKLELKESRIFIKGGSTYHWGGWSLRFKPEDFHLKSNTGYALDWPFGYEELEPFYSQAEKIIGVAGDGGDPGHPPRSGGFPNKPAPFTVADGPVIEAMKSLGHTYDHMPIARNERCVATGTCKYCPLGGRYAAPFTLEDIVDQENIYLLTGAPASKILMADKKRASGVEYRNPVTNLTEVVLAETVIICAGALESPKLLLASANPYWPQGLGNASGHVGRHIVTHPMLWVDGTLPNNPDSLQQEINFPTLCSRSFDTPEYQKEGKLFFFRQAKAPNLDIAKLIIGGASIDTIREASVGATTFNLGAFIEQFEMEGNRVGIGEGLNRFGIPNTKIEYRENPVNTAAVNKKYIPMLKDILRKMGCENIVGGLQTPRADHSVATCRMSSNESEGVVDANLLIHGVNNVYVVSNAVFPNVAAVNPTLTLAAVSLRFGEKVVL